MKQCLLTIVLISLGGPLFAQSMNVMTWNVRYNNAADGENAWPQRKDWVAEIVTNNKVDIAGFQEVRVEQLKDLQERLPAMISYGVGRDDGQEAGEFTPIFVNKDRFEILDKGTYWLSPTPDKAGSKGWDAALPRIASWVKIKDRTTSATWYVLNTHFDHQGKEARLKSAELVLSWIQDQFQDHPLMLLGDFNAKPDAPPIEKLIGKGEAQPLLFDSYVHTATKPEGPDSTWNGFAEIVPQQRIDFVFVTKGVKVQSLRTLDDQRDGRFPSDHLPIVVQVEAAAR